MKEFEGRKWKVIVLRKPLLCLPESGLARELFAKVQVLKINAYNKARGPAGKVIPLDHYDYISDHYLLCECDDEGPAFVRSAFRHLNLTQVISYNLEHPLESLFRHSQDKGHYKFLIEKIDSLRTRGGELTYISRMCMDENLLSRRELKRFAWGVFKSAQVREKAGPNHEFIMGHLSRYNLNGLFTGLGYRPIAIKDPLGPIVHKVFDNEDVTFYLSNEFTKDAIIESNGLKGLWDDSLVIGDKPQTILPEQMLQVA